MKDLKSTVLSAKQLREFDLERQKIRRWRRMIPQILSQEIKNSNIVLLPYGEIDNSSFAKQNTI